jgi:hypothetical protein
MATLNPYFGPHAGSLTISVGFFQIGSGSFTAFSDFQANFAGSYSVVGHDGSFTLAIGLTDQNPASASGPCKITLSDKTDAAATYKVNGSKLTITTSLIDTPIDVYVQDNGTQIDNIQGQSISIKQSDGAEDV